MRWRVIEYVADPGGDDYPGRDRVPGRASVRDMFTFSFREYRDRLQIEREVYHSIALGESITMI
jgi:hypothetical protein